MTMNPHAYTLFIATVFAATPLSCGGNVGSESNATDAGGGSSDALADITTDSPTDQGGETGEETDADADVVADRVEEDPLAPIDPVPDPPGSAFDCVNEWPSFTTPAPSASLNKRRLDVRLVANVETNLSDVSPSAYSEGYLAFADAAKLVSYNVTTHKYSVYDQWVGKASRVSPPVARKDMPGAFVFGAHVVASFSPSFSAGPDWSLVLSASRIPGASATETSRILAGPDGNLYLTATDATLRVLQSATGDRVSLYNFSLGKGHILREPDFGIGDRYFVSGRSYLRAGGVAYEPPVHDGKKVKVIAATYAHQLVGYYDVDDETSRHLVVLDRCGKFQWSAPVQPKQVLLGFDDALIVLSPSSTGKNAASVYSRDGRRLAGPVNDVGTLLALGADNVVYVGVCDNVGEDRHLSIRALSPTLEQLASLGVGGLCSERHEPDAVLLEDGLLLVPAREEKQGVLVGFVETASPGLARTAWPTRMRDNLRSGWVASW